MAVVLTDEEAAVVRRVLSELTRPRTYPEAELVQRCIVLVSKHQPS